MYDGFQRAALGDAGCGIPLIYGVDAVHGHNNVVRRDDLPAQHRPRRHPRPRRWCSASAGRRPRRSPGTGIDWDFAPCLCVARNDRWGRTYESFGETPEIVVADDARWSPACRARGSVARRRCWPPPSTTSATAARPAATTRATPQLSEAELRAIHLPPFRAAIARGVGSVMVSYQQLERREDARPAVPDHRRAQGRAGLHGLRRLGLDGDRPARRPAGLHAPTRSAARSTPASTW